MNLGLDNKPATVKALPFDDVDDDDSAGGTGGTPALCFFVTTRCRHGWNTASNNSLLALHELDIERGIEQQQQQQQQASLKGGSSAKGSGKGGCGAGSGGAGGGRDPRVVGTLAARANDLGNNSGSLPHSHSHSSPQTQSNTNLNSNINPLSNQQSTNKNINNYNACGRRAEEGNR